MNVSLDYPLASSEVEKDDRFVVAMIDGATYYGCYFSPNQLIEEFNAYVA